jgi:hypothetical protein
MEEAVLRRGLKNEGDDIILNFDYKYCKLI